VTVLAGVIANHYGPNIGGLFLAFPAIFPATATLLEKHEKQKEPSYLRAREVAGIDAAGASMESIGLILFAIIIWQGLTRHSLTAVLAVSIVAWLLVAVAAWWIRKTWLRRLRLTRGRKMNCKSEEIR
jgi:TRAP-type C4-dicarboxylate transport system permease large subunit